MCPLLSFVTSCGIINSFELVKVLQDSCNEVILDYESVCVVHPSSVVKAPHFRIA